MPFVLQVWDLQGGFCTHSFSGHGGVVLRVAFHPKQLLLFSASDDSEVRVWDLVEKKCTAVLKVRGREGSGDGGGGGQLNGETKERRGR